MNKDINIYLPDANEALKHECIVNDKEKFKWLATEGKPVKAAKLVYMEHNNVSYADLEGLYIHKVCCNKHCVNPLHLFAWDRGKNPFKNRKIIKLFDVNQGEKEEVKLEDDFIPLKWPQTKGYRSF